MIPAVLDRLEDLDALDAVIGPIRNVARSLPPQRLKDVLRGRWLGHAAHPSLVQVPIGAWMAAGVMDVLGDERAARRLTAFGVLTAAPAAAAGWVDWAELRPRQLRTGLVHAAFNASSVAVFSASLVARYRGRARTGQALGLLGLLGVGAGGLIGGHLAYRQGAGVNHAEQVPVLVPPGWHSLGSVEQYVSGESTRHFVGPVPVMVRREPGDAFHVLADQCSHLSGPLSEGDAADGCVQCPWHGSVFRLGDGAVVSGPATAPQPVFETRVREGRLEVRLPSAG